MDVSGSWKGRLVPYRRRKRRVLQGRSGAVKETMGWYGKLIGAVLGAIVGRGLLGAIVGFIIGHLYDRASTAGARSGSRRGPAAAPLPPSPDLQQAFFRATFQIMGHVAKADGHVTEQEIDAARSAMRRFSLGEADVQRAIRFYTEGKSADFPLDDVLGAFRAATPGREDLRRLFVQIQLEAALQGAGLSARSRAVLGRACDALGVSAIEFAALEAMLRMRGPAAAGGERGAAEELADAYQALGVAPEATDAEVTLAYRRLMSQNHPDKLVANGLPQSMIEAAHERTRRLIAAYELLRKHRGMK
jgi:DnaJ like chaperone protein